MITSESMYGLRVTQWVEVAVLKLASQQVFTVAGLKILTALLLKKNLTQETKEELPLLELFWYGEGIPVRLIMSILKSK